MTSTAPSRPRGPSVNDLVSGGAALFLQAAGSVTRRAGPIVSVAGSWALRPPGVPHRLQPVNLLAPVAARGPGQRERLIRTVSRWIDVLVPMVLDEVLRRAQVTELVLRYVDLDQLVAAVDLDDAVRRVDIDRIIDEVDVAAVLARVDVDDVARRVDIDALARRLDVDQVLERIDLTTLILSRVDLQPVIDACLVHLDLVGLAEQIIEGVDLPEIIRESTGTMASDTVRGARMQGVVADEAVGRAVDRLLLRGRRGSAPSTAGEPPLGSARDALPSQRRRDYSR